MLNVNDSQASLQDLKINNIRQTYLFNFILKRYNHYNEKQAKKNK